MPCWQHETAMLSCLRRLGDLRQERSSSGKAFSLFQNFFDLHSVPFRPLCGRKARIYRLDDKSFWFGNRCCLGKTGAEEAIDGFLHRFAGAANLFVEERRDIIIESKSCSHIMMLSMGAS